MRLVQKLNRKFKNIDELVKSANKFEEKFNKLNHKNKLKCNTNMEIGEEYLLEIEIYEE